MSQPLLELTGVHTHIGAYHILHGVDFAVPEGGVTMLLGRNGAGKTTTLKSIMGVIGKRKGSASTSDWREPALLETVREEGGRLDRYIQNLLDMTRIGHGALSRGSPAARKA